MNLLEQLTEEYLTIFERSPSRLKIKLNSAIKELTTSTRSGDSSSRSQNEHRSSSHHRPSASSTSSSHHPTKQSMPPSSHSKLPHGSSSSTAPSTSGMNMVQNRHRPDRNERPLGPDRTYFSTPHRPGQGGNTSGSGNSSNANGQSASMRSGGNNNNSNSGNTATMQSTSSSQQQRQSNHGQHDQNIFQRSSDKIRSSGSSMQQSSSVSQQQRHGSSQSSLPPHKIDQRHPMKDSKSHIDAANVNKNPIKNPHQQSSSHYASGTQSIPTTKHSSSALYSQQQQQSQSSGARNNNSLQSDQQQTNSSSVHNLQRSQPTLIDQSSYDISNIGSLDTMDLLAPTSPPKSKTYSIFSPEWNEKSSSLPSIMSGNESNGSETRNALEDSPKKRGMPTIDSIKKEKRPESTFNPVMSHNNPSQNSVSQSNHQNRNMPNQLVDKRQQQQNPNVKREVTLSHGMQYDTSLPQNILDSKPIKRPYNSDQTVNDNDYRDSKVRKIEPLSPLRSSNEQKSGHDDFKSKPFGTTMSASSSLNGIETNPDLVSSLLKESLNETKYSTTTLAAAPPTNSTTAQGFPPHMNSYQMHQQQVDPQKHQSMQQQQAPQMPIPSNIMGNQMFHTQSQISATSTTVSQAPLSQPQQIMYQQQQPSMMQNVPQTNLSQTMEQIP